MAPGKVKLGILLPTRGILLKPRPVLDAKLLMRLARQVEAAGLDSVWVGDSLTAKPRLEAMAILAALAACTERVRLGTAVLLAGLRHPVLLAQAMATVDMISDGRLVVGAGVGGAFNDEQLQEWYAAGVDPKRRASRFEEVLEIVQQLGQGDPVTYTGKHFALDQVRMQPRTVQPNGVPILLATHWRAQKEQQLRRAARLGSGLMSITDSPEEFRELVQRTGELVSSLGRVASRFENAYYMTVNVNRDAGKAESEADEFLTGYYGVNHWGDRWGPFGEAERIRDRMAEFAEAGADTLVVRFASFEPEAQLEAFLEQVAGEWAR